MKFKFFALAVLFSLAGCFQTHSEDDALNSVPVTNNPYVVPSHGSGMPMGGGGSPY